MVINLVSGSLAPDAHGTLHTWKEGFNITALSLELAVPSMELLKT